MGGVNTRRVLLGGLVAGVVINVGEYLLNGVILVSYYVDLTQRLGVPVMPISTIAIFVLLAFVIGVVGVWLYAAARPRLGPGPVTALKVGTAIWFFSYVMTQMGYWGLGIMSFNMALGVMGWGLVELNLGVLVGAWVYREQ